MRLPPSGTNITLMSAKKQLTFKIATEDWEFEAVHRLNYRTFAEEIPQHACNEMGRLVDKFHEQNTYIIALCADLLVGMVALRGTRPFSLDHKLDHLDSYLPPDRKLCEIRLLAVEKDFRYGQVTVGLLSTLARRAIEEGFDAAVISGTTRQIRLYEHMGFRQFGPLVGTGEAQFQPMFLSLESFENGSAALLESRRRSLEPAAEVNFLPGPVAIPKRVQESFNGQPISHRSGVFMSECASARAILCRLTNARHCQVMMGSGTMANETVGAQLSLLDEPGVVISNGEFGERLLDQATRWGLRFHHLKLGWGEALREERLRDFLRHHSGAKWLWTTHCETSTSLLNPLPLLRQVCAERNIKLCLDCISTVGVVSVDLSGVHLATCASGKGLAAYPGLAIVFHDHEIPASQRLPRYLDLGHFARCEGIPFTLNTNLLHALKTSLETTNWEQKIASVQETGDWLRQRLKVLGCELVGDECSWTPAVVTIALPKSISSRNIGWQFKKAGFLLSYQSEYLLKRNWIQICLMGEFTRSDLERLLTEFESIAPASVSYQADLCAS